MAYAQWSPEHDFILKFLFLHKVSTTTMLNLALTGSRKGQRVYFKLLKLQKSGFIRCTCNTIGNHWVWSLTRRGYSVVRARLPSEIESGYLSEDVAHDIYSASILLGDWIHKRPLGVSILTEQQIQRFKREDLPHWNPDLGRIPDGLIHINNGTNSSRMVAFEVEVKTRFAMEYGDIGSTYDATEGISDVIWLIAGANIARTIANGLKRNVSETSKCRHHFLTVDAFIKGGWHANFFHGNCTVAEVLSINANRAQTERSPVSPMFYVDGSKTPFRSKTCKPIRLRENFN